jgi:hypothetical protein
VLLWGLLTSSKTTLSKTINLIWKIKGFTLSKGTYSVTYEPLKPVGGGYPRSVREWKNGSKGGQMLGKVMLVRFLRIFFDKVICHRWFLTVILMKWFFAFFDKVSFDKVTPSRCCCNTSTATNTRLLITSNDRKMLILKTIFFFFCTLCRKKSARLLLVLPFCKLKFSYSRLFLFLFLSICLYQFS